MRTFNCFFFFSLHLLVFSWFNYLPIQAQQNFYVKYFTTENGLPNNTIRGISQDQTGFLWIATWDGLSRYDGYEFKNYYHNPGDSTSLPYFTLHKICVDKNNNLWILTENGQLCLYKRAADNFKTFTQFTGKNKGKQFIADISIDQNKDFWVFMTNSTLKFDYEQARFKSFKILDQNNKPLLSTDFYYSASFDNKNHLWLIGEKIYRCILDTNKNSGNTRINMVYNFNRPIAIVNSVYANNPFFSMYESIGKQVWFVTNFGLYYLDALKNEFRESYTSFPQKENNNNMPFIWGQKNSGLFVATKGHEMITIPDEICQNSIAAYVDRNYSIWTGSLTESGFGKGLTRYIKTPSIFKHPQIEIQNSNNKLSVFSIIKDKHGNVWVGSRGYDHLFKIDKIGLVNTYNQLTPELFHKSGFLRSMMEDSNGLWLGYNNNLLTHYVPGSGKFEKIFLNHNTGIEKDTPIYIHSLLLGKKGKLIIGSISVFQYDVKSKKLEKVWKSNDGLPIYCITQDEKGNYWLGKTSEEIIQLNSSFQEIKRVKLCSDHYNVESICLGDNNDLWLALLGGGVCHLDRISGKTEFLTTANGLSNNTTYSILKDKKGYLWISTNHGISRYNPHAMQFRTFGFTDGLKIDEFNSDASFLASDGEMFFGGMGGIVRFYPDSLDENKSTDQSSNLVITDFKVSGLTRHFSKPVYDADAITLAKGDNNFQITFSSLNLKDPDKIKYRYKMTGFSNQWVETDFQHRFVNYANVKPGTYKLSLGATNHLGVWKYQTDLTLIIPPFYYQTLWFKGMVISVSLIIVITILVIYFKQLRLRNVQVQNHLKLESLRGQMNPHFVFNSLNSINYFISQNDRLSANRYIADFSRLIRAILDNMACNYITIDKELESIEDYLKLEHLRFSDKFDYQLIVPENIIIENIEVFPGMVQPFIENAIWHGVRGLEGRKGTVTVRFIETNQKNWQCTVEDDGVGRKHSTVSEIQTGRRSRGIAIVNDRLKIYNNLWKVQNKIEITNLYPDKIESGTRVVIDIPIKPLN